MFKINTNNIRLRTKVLSCFLIIIFVLTNNFPYVIFIANAKELQQLRNETSRYDPLIIRGISIFPDNPLKFDFLVEQGNDPTNKDDIEKETAKLIKYFLTSVTIPESDTWVNLSPYEKERIIPKNLGQTDMGQSLLELDYLLKNLTSTLLNPETDLGGKFWDKIYADAYKKYKTTNIDINTFNKVWIIPKKAVIYTNSGHAYIVESSLKVLIDKDYSALKNEKRIKSDTNDIDEKMDIASKIMNELVIPNIEKEVNEGKTFAQLRQIYNSMIIASWYKKHLKNSILNQIYVNKNKIDGIDSKDKEKCKKIYDQYVDLFTEGAFNYIREEYDPVDQVIIPKKYFSGGINIFDKIPLEETSDIKYEALINDAEENPDKAMIVSANLSAKTKPAITEVIPDKNVVSHMPKDDVLNQMKYLSAIKMTRSLLLANEPFTNPELTYRFFSKKLLDRPGTDQIKADYTRFENLSDEIIKNADEKYQMIAINLGNTIFNKDDIKDQLKDSALSETINLIKKIQTINPNISLVIYFKGDLTNELIDRLGNDLHYYSDNFSIKTHDPSEFINNILTDFTNKQISKRLSKENEDIYRFMDNNKNKVASDILRAALLSRSDIIEENNLIDTVREQIKETPDTFQYVNENSVDIFQRIYPEETAKINNIIQTFNKQNRTTFPLGIIRNLKIPANKWWAEFCLGTEFVNAFSAYINFENLTVDQLIEKIGRQGENNTFVINENFGKPDSVILDPANFIHQTTVLKKMSIVMSAGSYQNLLKQLSFDQILNIYDFSIQEKIPLAENYYASLLADVQISENNANKQFVLTFLNKLDVNTDDLTERSNQVKQYRAAFELLMEAEELNDKLLEIMMLHSQNKKANKSNVSYLMNNTNKFLELLRKIISNSNASNISAEENTILSKHYKTFYNLQVLINKQDEKSADWQNFVQKMMIYDEDDLRIHSLIHHVHTDILNQTVLSWIGMNAYGGDFNRDMNIHIVDTNGNLSRHKPSGVFFAEDHSPENVAMQKNSFNFQYLNLSKGDDISEGARSFFINVFSRLLGMTFIPSNRYKAVLMDNQICLYLGIDGGVHVPLLFVSLGDPSKRGKITVRWNDSKDNGGKLRNELINQLLTNLDFETQSADLMTVGTFDRNTNAMSRYDIETRALMISSIFTIFTNVDLYLKLQKVSEKDIPNIANNILDMGTFNIFEMIKDGKPQIDLSVVEKTIGLLNEKLASLDLDQIDPKPFLSGKEAFSQKVIDNQFNWPIQRLLNSSIVEIDTEGGIKRISEFKEPKKTFSVTKGIALAQAVEFKEEKPADYYKNKIVIAERLGLNDITKIEQAAGIITKKGNTTGHLAINISEMYIPWIVTDNIPKFEENELCLVDADRTVVKFNNDAVMPSGLTLENDYLDEVIKNIPFMNSLEELYLVFNEINKRSSNTKSMDKFMEEKLLRIWARIINRIEILQDKAFADVSEILKTIQDNNTNIETLNTSEIDKLIRTQKRVARLFGSIRPQIYDKLKEKIKEYENLFAENYKDQELIPFSNGGKVSSRFVGNKASKLVETQNMLKNSKFAPYLHFTEGFLISTTEFENFFKANFGTSADQWLSNHSESSANLIIKNFINSDLPTDTKQNISETYDRLLKGKRVSIRSSSMLEDNSDFSFAGMAQTYLNVDKEQIPFSIKMVWSSLLGSRAIEYLKRNDLNIFDLRQGQIVQEMVEADVSGVLRTVNPNEIHSNKMVAETVYGLGPGVVEDEVGADRIEINKTDNNFEITVNEKDEQFVSNDSKKQGIIKTKVDYRKSIKPSLNKTQISLLAEVAKLIEDYFGYPLDIEFCFTNDKLTILQVRPLSSLFGINATNFADELKENLSDNLFDKLSEIEINDLMKQETRLQKAETAKKDTNQDSYGGINLDLNQIDFEANSDFDNFYKFSGLGNIDIKSLTGFSPSILNIDYSVSIQGFLGIK